MGGPEETPPRVPQLRLARQLLRTIGDHDMSKRKKETLKAIPPKSFEPSAKTKDGMEVVCKVCRRLLESDGPHNCRPDPIRHILDEAAANGEAMRQAMEGGHA